MFDHDPNGDLALEQLSGSVISYLALVLQQDSDRLVQLGSDCSFAAYVLAVPSDEVVRDADAEVVAGQPQYIEPFTDAW